MSRETLTNDILNFALDEAGEKFPKTWGGKSLGKNVTQTFETDEFFEKLTGYLEESGAISNNVDVSQDRKVGARASAFTVSVLSRLYMTNSFCESIDKYLDDPAKNSQMDFKTPEEKEAFRREIKDKVRNDLAVKPKTKEGEALVDKLSKEFDKIADTREKYKGMEEQLKKDGVDLNTMGAEGLDNGLSAIFSLNTNLHVGKSLQQSEEFVRNNIANNNSIQTIIADSIRNDAIALAGEEEVITHTTNSFNLFVDNGTDVHPVDFLKHYESGKVNQDEKDWAQFTMSRLRIKYEDYGNLSVDGQPMFKPEQLKKENEADRAVEVVAATLSAKQVTFTKDGKETLLNPTIIGTEKDSHKGIIDKIIDIFRMLVGLGPKEMVQDKINAINSKNNEEKEKFEAKSRERISFDELSGLKAATKLTAPTKQNTLSAEKKGPSVGK